jgi:hypothetical protein
MADETTVRVSLRGNELAAAAPMRTSGDELFIALDQAPPVRATLELQAGGDTRRITVLRVQRTEQGGQPTGFFARYIDEAPGAKVGSEHLRANPDLVHQVVQEDSGPDVYPVPAPVLDAEPSEPIDLRELEARERAAQAQVPAEEPAAVAESPADPEPTKSRGKQRKGRKRG